MFDPGDDRKLKRLRTAMKESCKALEVFQQRRHEAYEQFVGSFYSDSGTKEPVPLNMIELAASIMLRSLVSADPRALVHSKRPEWKADAYSFELALNHGLREMMIGRSLKTWAFEAMMSPMGVLKVALDVESAQSLDGMQVWAGKPFVEPVTYDDWVHDMSAKAMHRIGFCGNRYSVVKDWALESGVYDPDVVAKLQPSQQPPGENDSQRLSRSRGWLDEDYRDTLKLWDLWLPDEGLIVTLSDEDEDLPPLRVVEWSGPERGPYHFLWFNEVPGNTVPLPPVATWRSIHDLANALFNKLGRQAMRQKTLTGVPGTAAGDMKRITEAGDGEGVYLDAPGETQEIRFGGFDNQNFGFVLQLKQLYSYYAGNIDALGGLAIQSGTVGQDQLLANTASQRIQSMQDETYAATRQVIRDVGWYLWTDPIAEIPIVKRIAGTQATVSSVWSQLTARGDWYDFDLDIEPYSLQAQSPAERLAKIDQFLMNVLVPALPLMQQQGIAVNFEEIIKLHAKYGNIPELNDIVTYLNGEMTTLPGEEGASPAPKASTRRYVRESRSTKTPQGQEQSLINSLMSGADQGGAP